MSMPLLAVLALHLASASPAVFIQDANVLVGDGTTLPATSVLLKDGKIVAVGKGLKAPAGAVVVDGRGKTLTPGLIETQSQEGLMEVMMEKTTVDHTMDGSATPAFNPAEGFNPLSVRIPLAREEGITTVLMSPLGSFLYGLGSWVDMRSDLSALPSAPVALFGNVDKSAAATTGNARGGLWMRLHEIVSDARAYKKHKKAWEKAAYRGLSLKPLQLEAMLPVLAGKMPFVVEVHRASDILALLRFKDSVDTKKEKMRLVLVGGSEAWMVADALARRKIPVIVTPSQQAPYSFSMVHARDDLAAQLEKAGVPIILSSGGGDENIRRLRQEAGMGVAYGLTHDAALRAITQTPAAVFGRKDLGTVATGKRADVVLWSGDPFALDTVAEVVYIAGERQSLDTRQKQLARRYLER